MKSILFACIAGILSSAHCLADIKLAGGIQPAKTVQYTEGMGLIDALNGSRSLTCSRIMLARGKDRFEIDLPSVLASPEKEWALQDGDIILMPEHIFPCMSDRQSDAFITLFREYIKIKNGTVARPKDWQKRIEKLPTHRKKTEPNQTPEPTPTAVTPDADASVAPSVGAARL